jgi:hypothetical protein
MGFFRTVLKWLVIAAVVVIVGSAILHDPTGAGHKVGGWIDGFIHACEAIGTFLTSL